MIVGGRILGFIGCTKNQNDVADIKEKLFAQIAQVDKDGTKTYSGVVKVISK